MSEEKFTPAPWYIQKDGWLVEIVSEYGERVCTIDGLPQRRKPNANLLNAAPEMYYALEAICNDCAGSCVMNDYNKNCRGCTIPNLLKKARGEE